MYDPSAAASSRRPSRRRGHCAARWSHESRERTAGRRADFALYAVYGISVEGVIDITVQEACRRDRIASYRHVRLSTFGRVRQAGFAFPATFDHPHFTLVLPDLSELTLRRLDRCFDPSIPNPGADTRRVT